MAERSNVITEKHTKKVRPASFNVAKSKDLYTGLPAPKPRRTHSAGLSGIVELITEHLKSSPPPSLRQSSPHPGKYIANPFLTHESNRCSSASITEEQQHDTFNPTGVNLGSSIFQPSHAPAAMLAEFCATPFLGDRKSESGDLNLLFASSSGIRRGGQRIGEHNFTMTGFRRSFSLEGLSGKAALSPCMIAMPAGRPYYDLSDALESIPPHSWILPYVIACTPPEILGQLLALPFLVEGQSHTHTTATAITRSRAHTISYDIDPAESENDAFTVPLNIKGAKVVTSASVATEQDTPVVDSEDWYSYDTRAPFDVPLKESNPRRAEHMSSTSPLDDLPVTRARGHTHTGSVYELPDPSLFNNIPPKTTSRARDSIGRKKEGDFGSLIRMSSASPRFGGSTGGYQGGSGKYNKPDTNADKARNKAQWELQESHESYKGEYSSIQLPIAAAVVPAPVSTTTHSLHHPPLLAPAPIKPNTGPFSLTNPLPIPRTPSPATLGIAPQTMNFPSSWRSLGILWLCSDPKWNQWHPKIVFLLDNYLLECTAIGTAVIGYSQLSGAVIEKKMFQYHARLPTQKPHKTQVPTAHPANEKHISVGNAVQSTTEDDYFHEILNEEADFASEDDFSPRHASSGSTPHSPHTAATNTGHTYHTAHGAGQLASYGLKITSFTTSNIHPNTDPISHKNSNHSTKPNMGFNKNAMEPNTHSFWLTTHDEASLDLIAVALQVTLLTVYFPRLLV